MKLIEITVDDQEPLLIVMMRKLLAKEDKIWHKGSFAKLQVKNIGLVSIDRPQRSVDKPAYRGKAYDIKLHHGIGMNIAPDEADDYELVKDSPGNWTLQKVKT